MITQKEAELEVLSNLMAHIDSQYAVYGENKYANKYVKSLNKYNDVLMKRYRTIDNNMHPVAGEA